jgi:hypothetical protein
VTTPADEAARTRYRCTGWTGTGSVSASGTAATTTFTITAPSSITWNWIAQYQLTVYVDPTAIRIGNVTIDPIGEDRSSDSDWISYWYDEGREVTLTAQSMISDKYLFAYWSVDGTDYAYFTTSITVDIDEPYTATATYIEYLPDAKVELSNLKTYLKDLSTAGKIGKKEYDYFIKAINKIEKDIDRAMKQLDRTDPRKGFDDRQKGFEDLRHAVMKINRLIHQVEEWRAKGKISPDDAAKIIGELEKIRMKLVYKAWAEALAEKALALKAIADAESKGGDTTKAWEEIAKVDRELAKAMEKIAEGKYSQAIQHFKHAFTHSQHAVKKAYDPSFSIDYKDWIDELEEEEP